MPYNNKHLYLIVIVMGLNSVTGFGKDKDSNNFNDSNNFAEHRKILEISPSNRYMLFEKRDKSSRSFEIEDNKTHKKIDLGEKSRFGDMHHQFSPDGNKIAFSRRENENGQKMSGISVYDINLNRMIKISTDHGMLPQWIDNGQWIAYTIDREDRSGKDIQIVPYPDNGSRKQQVITSGFWVKGNPKLPYIAFIRDTQSEICLIVKNIQTGNEIKLQLFTRYEWSPDGKNLLMIKDSINNREIVVSSVVCIFNLDTRQISIVDSGQQAVNKKYIWTVENELIKQ